MSINPLLNEQGTEPLRLDNEYFILKRNDIYYKLTSEDNGKHEGEGILFLTSNRLVIIPTKHNSAFKSLQIPLKIIYDETFKQPFFGKNYLFAKCQQIFASPFGNFSIQIWFRNSHAGTIINALFTLLDSLRHNNNKKHDDNIINSLKENNFTKYFAIDPDDPSDIYQIQPISVNIPKQNYQSVIVDHPPAMVINSDINQQIQNEQQLKYKNDLYMSQFIYKNPEPNHSFVYKDPGFVYKDPNSDENNKINNNENNVNFINPNNQQNMNNNFNNNIPYGNYPYDMSNVVMNNNVPNQQNYVPQNYNLNINNNLNPNNIYSNNNVMNPYSQITNSINNNNNQNNNSNNIISHEMNKIIKKSEGYRKLKEEDENYNEDLSSRNMLDDNLKDKGICGIESNNIKDKTNNNQSLLNDQNSINS